MELLWKKRVQTMNDKNYTEEEIMSALELRIYRDTLCRESYELIKAKKP